MLLSICRICIQVQSDVSAPGSPPHLCVMFWHRECRELECGAPAALGEGAFAGTRLVRRFCPMDEHERAGRGLVSSATPTVGRRNRKSKMSQAASLCPPVHSGVDYNNLNNLVRRVVWVHGRIEWFRLFCHETREPRTCCLCLARGSATQYIRIIQGVVGRSGPVECWSLGTVSIWPLTFEW